MEATTKAAASRRLRDRLPRFRGGVRETRRARGNRKRYGDVIVFLFLTMIGLFSALPLVMAVGMFLKPLNELFYYPPTILPSHPTLDNFVMLFSLMKTTWVPFARYAFNTLFITLAATIGHILLASLAAYPLAKVDFIGRKTINAMVMFSLMFVASINDIANYLTISWLGWLDTYLAAIIPSMGASLGLFIMINYMRTIPDSLIEASRIDGCSEFGTYRRIIMPMAKPAYLTVLILMFQQLWNQNNADYVYNENLKTLPYALTQITTGGLIRTGAAQAVGVLMLIVPAAVFIVNQTKIIDTMATSGIKE